MVALENKHVLEDDDDVVVHSNPKKIQRAR